MPFGEVRGGIVPDRHAWLDHARGIGIILVVYAHQLRAQAAIGHVPTSWGGPFQDALIYSFHMPLFFFISGIVSLRSIRTKPFAASLSDKLKGIAYPYFLWSVISWCLSAMAVKYVNRPMDVSNLLSIVYQPILQYWFLYILFLCQLVALILQRFFVANVVIAAILLIVPIPFVNSTLNEFVTSFPFFVVGMMLSGTLLSNADRRVIRWEAPAAWLALTVFLILVCARFDSGSFAFMASLARAWLGIAFIVILSRIIGPRLPWLSALGQASMAVFVLHTIVAAAIRAVVTAAGVQAPLGMLIACVAGGLIAPLIVVHIAARYRLETWLGLGKTTERCPPPARLL